MDQVSFTFKEYYDLSFITGLLAIFKINIAIAFKTCLFYYPFTCP